MDRDIKEFVYLRCERALEENKEYMEAEKSGKVDQDELQQQAEALCYLKGFKDMMEFIGIKYEPEDLLMVAKTGSHLRG